MNKFFSSALNFEFLYPGMAFVTKDLKKFVSLLNFLKSNKARKQKIELTFHSMKNSYKYLALSLSEMSKL